MTHQLVGIKGEHVLRLLKRLWEAAFYREMVVAMWKVTGYVPFTSQVYWNLLRKENQMAETIATAMVQSNLIHKASQM